MLFVAGRKNSAIGALGTTENDIQAHIHRNAASNIDAFISSDLEPTSMRGMCLPNVDKYQFLVDEWLSHEDPSHSLVNTVHRRKH